MDALTQAPNYSFYAIPAFWALIIVPSAYGTALVKSKAKGRFDNHNPRGENYRNFLRKTVDSDTFTKWERCQAAHTNGWENLPLFASAVICGNMAGLDPGLLNLASAAFLGLRVAHTAAYISIDKLSTSFVRSGIYVSSVGCCLFLLISAANVMASGGPLKL